MNRSHPPRVLDTAITVCLVVTLAALGYGHVGARASGLSPIDNYLTEYIKQAPHWPWLVVSCFSFALLLTLLAFAFLLRAPRSSLRILGCLLLAATAMANFFAAYAPVRRVEQPPPPSHQWWTPSWWFTSRTARSAYENGLADAYSDVHYRATRLVVVTVVGAVLLLGCSHLLQPGERAFGCWSLGAALTMSVFFIMGDRLDVLRGLWQRLGFVILYAWLWRAHRACRRHQDRGIAPPAGPPTESVPMLL